MSDNLISAIVAIVTAILGVAIIAALVSKNSQTSSVIKAAGSSFTKILSAALGPITGASSSGIGSVGLSNPMLQGFAMNELTGEGF